MKYRYANGKKTKQAVAEPGQAQVQFIESCQ